MYGDGVGQSGKFKLLLYANIPPPFSLSFEPTGVTSYIIIGICITFAITAFAWWWWVIHAVKDIFNLLGEANKRFAEVIKELKQIKEDYFKKKD